MRNLQVLSDHDFMFLVRFHKIQIGKVEIICLSNHLKERQGDFKSGHRVSGSEGDILFHFIDDLFKALLDDDSKEFIVHYHFCALCNF